MKPAVRVSDALHGCLLLTLHRAARRIQDLLAHLLLVSKLIRTYAGDPLLEILSDLASKMGTGCQRRLDGLMNEARNSCQRRLGRDSSLRERERLRTNLEFAYVGLEDSWHRADVGISR